MPAALVMPSKKASSSSWSPTAPVGPVHAGSWHMQCQNHMQGHGTGSVRITCWVTAHAVSESHAGHKSHAGYESHAVYDSGWHAVQLVHSRFGITCCYTVHVSVVFHLKFSTRVLKSPDSYKLLLAVFLFGRLPGCRAEVFTRV